MDADDRVYRRIFFREGDGALAARDARANGDDSGYSRVRRALNDFIEIIGKVRVVQVSMGVD
jgi:hypothetical protein